jgi:hypothetical protein
LRKNNRKLDKSFGKEYDWLCFCWVSPNLQTKKGTKFDSKDNNIQLKSQDEVKPYVKKVAVKNKFTQFCIQLIDLFLV